MIGGVEDVLGRSGDAMSFFGFFPFFSLLYLPFHSSQRVANDSVQMTGMSSSGKCDCLLVRESEGIRNGLDEEIY